MFKKLFAIAAILFLTACSSRLSGETVTTCTNAPSTVIDGDTNVTIEGYDEDIHTWTERLTLTREQFTVYLLEGESLTDDEIAELFEYLNTFEAEGFELRLISLNDSEVIIEYVYDYTLISNEELSDLWNVDDFEKEVTLSVAIRGLEDQDAICNTE